MLQPEMIATESDGCRCGYVDEECAAEAASEPSCKEQGICFSIPAKEDKDILTCNLHSAESAPDE